MNDNNQHKSKVMQEVEVILDILAHTCKKYSLSLTAIIEGDDALMIGIVNYKSKEYPITQLSMEFLEVVGVIPSTNEDAPQQEVTH